jgi:hypothetical protein
MRSVAPSLTTADLAAALSANAFKVGDFVASGRVDVEAAVGSLTNQRGGSNTTSSTGTGRAASTPD